MTICHSCGGTCFLARRNASLLCSFRGGQKSIQSGMPINMISVERTSPPAIESRHDN